MKIEKLYTLSQFVDHVRDLTIRIGRMEIQESKLYIIVKYNEFLKQPLKKVFSENKDIFKRTFLKDVGFGTKEVRANKIRIGYINKGGDFQSTYKTLYDLAEKTIKELEFKNLEL